MNKQSSSKKENVILWIVQILLAVFFISAAIMKFMPIRKIAQQMPWMGQVSALDVRMLGITDLLAALGLILPSWLKIKLQLTPLSAVCIIILMINAIIFHVSRGERNQACCGKSLQLEKFSTGRNSSRYIIK